MNVIGKLEADEAELALVYHFFGELYKHYENDAAVQLKVKQRLDFLYTDSIGLAYMLTPKYAVNGHYFDNDQTEIIGYAKQFALNIQPEIAEKVEQEMIAFVSKLSNLTQSQQEITFQMNAKTYWGVIGRREFPSLFLIAKPITEMICSSAASERTWSTFRFLHSRLRNRLSNESVEKLVFVYTNSALMDKKDKTDYILEEGAMINGNDYEGVV